ncbi:MAG: hypothetical protein PVS3B1_26240 [Ktedonobacteraceae bacterium]
MSKRSPSLQVPKDLQARFEEITQLTDAFGQQFLNGEYVQLCRELTATLCRKRPSPLVRGKATTWAWSTFSLIPLRRLILPPVRSGSISV